VTVPVVLLVVSVALAVYIGLVRQSRATLLSSKEAAADMVVKLTSASVMPAVVFGDQQEMLRAVSNLARNPDVSDAELWGFQNSEMGETQGLLAEFHRHSPVALGRPGKGQQARFRDADSIRVLEPVVNLEGQTVAGLVVRFSTAREAATLAQLSRQVFYVSAATALCLAGAILLAIHRVVVRPVARLEEAAGRLARGDQQALESGRSPTRARVQDEVVRLAEKFGEMAEAVRDRERRLGVRNRDLKLILDSVEQGFLTARIDGTLFAERSAVVETWAGELPADATLWTLVGGIDPAAGEWLHFGWEQVSSQILPLEVAIDQLPRRMSRQEQHFSLNYHPVIVDGELERIVVVITDITAELLRQRALAEQQEFAALVDQFVRDRRAFHSFWQEASALVGEIVASSTSGEVLRRNVHTLKGNTRFFGLGRVSALCHELESAMAERGEYVLTEREKRALTEVWESLRSRIEPLMRGATVFLEVSREQYEQLIAAFERREPIEKLEQLVHDLRCEPIATRLENAKRLLQIGAKQLGKTPPNVELKHNDLRVPPGPWAPFWSVFSHVLNNALDHGLESDEERRAANKPVPGRMQLSIAATEHEIIVEMSDDGGGIDWELVRKHAAARQLPCRTRAELERALFSDRFSTREHVSQVSGRGVGLGAVEHVVTAMGGRIELESTAGVGTTWRFRFPEAFLTHSQSVPPSRPAANHGGGALAAAKAL
jgi:two-component system chemotaxis sensor kinase CheA